MRVIKTEFTIKVLCVTTEFYYEELAVYCGNHEVYYEHANHRT